MPTIHEVYFDTRQKLKSIGSSMPELEAKELIKCAMGKTWEEIQIDIGKYISDKTQKKILEMLEKRVNGCPLAYLLGEWDFYGLTFEISQDVLIPRADTETLVELCIEHCSDKKTRVLDLCCGSGCVGIAISSKCPDATVTLADISNEALAITQKNVRRHNQNASVMYVDALQPPPANFGQFDVIVCNPPYIPEHDWQFLDKSVRDYEPMLALVGGNEDGLLFYRYIASAWKSALKKDGTLFFEVGYNQSMLVHDILIREKYQQVRAHYDLNGILRVVSATK